MISNKNIIPDGFVMAFAGLINGKKIEVLRDQGWEYCNGDPVPEGDDYKGLLAALNGVIMPNTDEYKIKDLPDYRSMSLTGATNDRNDCWRDLEAEDRTDITKKNPIGANNPGGYQAEQVGEHNHAYGRKGITSWTAGVKDPKSLKEMNVYYLKEDTCPPRHSFYCSVKLDTFEDKQTRSNNISVHYFIKFNK